MKRKIKILLMVILGVLMCLGEVFASNSSTMQSQTILFTHDMHDHFLPIAEANDGVVEKTGGYTRLKSAIDYEKNKDQEALLVDAGDYSMGTLFQAIYTTDAPGLQMLGAMGYDVTTLGNHEFDFRAEGLTKNLQAALSSGAKLPKLVQANTIFPVDENGKMNPEIAELKKTMEAVNISPYTIINKNGMKIGVFGLMGKEAASNAPMSGVNFADPIESAKVVVSTLKEKENVDMIICLSHSGTKSNPKKSEDELLANAVPEIDVIISGHTHSVLEKPIIVGNTTIVSAGEYTDNLGVLKLNQTPQGRFTVDEYSLIPLNDKVPEDQGMLALSENYKTKIQKQYLDQFNLGFDEVIAYTPFNFVDGEDIGVKHAEEPLGSLMSDAYRFAVKEAEGVNYEPVAVAIVPSGTIRGSFTKGNITVSDAFTSSSLGVGADGISGYPLVSAYLTGRELKTACEVDASITPIMSPAQLYMSGMNYSFNPHRMIFNKVIDVKLKNEDGTFSEIEDDKLYRIVAGLYSAQMLSVVGDQSFGILSIVPKTKEGTPITDFEAHIIKDAEGKEIKEWLAIARYFKSFDKEDGVPQVPMQYSKPEGRKVVIEDTSLWAKIKNPNKITMTLVGIVILVIAIIAAIITMMVKKKKRKKTTLK